MINFIGRTALQIMIALGVSGAEAIRAGDWTMPVEVRHEVARCLSYRARLSGQYLVVQATLEPGWHTFAMDNSQRAKEKLAGKQSLGIERPTEIKVSQGLEVVGPLVSDAAEGRLEARAELVHLDLREGGSVCSEDPAFGGGARANRSSRPGLYGIDL